MAIGIVLGVFGLGFFCWLLFTLAVYALPFLAGLSAGLAAFHSGSGFVGALVVGLLVGVTILVLGQVILTTVRTPLIRLFIGLVYAVPAAIAGYQLCFALAGIGEPAVGWQQTFAAAGAIVVGLTAFARMAVLAPASTGQALGASVSLLAVLLTATRPDQSEALAIRIIKKLAKMGAVKFGSSSLRER